MKDNTQALCAARAALEAAEQARMEILLRHIANGGPDRQHHRGHRGHPSRSHRGPASCPAPSCGGPPVIGPGCVIGPNSLIEDSQVGEGTTVNASQVYSSCIGPHNAIGPLHPCAGGHRPPITASTWAPMWRPRTPTLPGANTVSHLTYIGDSDVGQILQLRLRHRHLQLRRPVQIPHHHRGLLLHRLQHQPRRPRLGGGRAPTPPPAAPSPRMCPRGPWPSSGAARPTSRAGPCPKWRPISRRNSGWKPSSWPTNRPGRTERPSTAGQRGICGCAARSPVPFLSAQTNDTRTETLYDNKRHLADRRAWAIPRPKYEGTRHNAGFAALDYLAGKWEIPVTKAKFQGLWGQGEVGRPQGLPAQAPHLYESVGGLHRPPGILFQDPGRPRHRPVRRTSPRPPASCASGPPARPGGTMASRASSPGWAPRRSPASASAWGKSPRPDYDLGRLGAGPLFGGGGQGCGRPPPRHRGSRPPHHGRPSWGRRKTATNR